jgi:hypothetical protein
MEAARFPNCSTQEAVLGLLYIAAAADGPVSSWGAGALILIAIPATVGGLTGYALVR